MIQRPPGVGAFQFVVLAMLRSAQLMRGCRPRVDGIHKATVTAQMEISEGKVTQDFAPLGKASAPATVSDALLATEQVLVHQT